MSKTTDIIETAEELAQFDDCDYFTFDGQTHLVKVVKCYDGDTFYCIFKCNGKYSKFKIRMLGYDSYEMKPSKSIPEIERKEIKRRAKAAKERLEELILNKNVYLICHEFEKYGRILGTVKININDTKSVNELMVEEGHGYEYHGGTKHQTV